MSIKTAFNDLSSIYEEHILPHAHSTAHRGRLDFPSRTGSFRNPRCGDEVCIDLAIDDKGYITRARFEAHGCLISQAAADILCEHVEGQSVEAIVLLRAETTLDLLHVPLTAARFECALLAFHCLRQLVRADVSSSTET